MAARETRPMHEAGSPPHPNVGDGDVDWDDVVTVRVHPRRGGRLLLQIRVSKEYPPPQSQLGSLRRISGEVLLCT